MSEQRPWPVTIASSIILGLVVGIPYYSIPFFYDYFEHSPANGGFGWSRASIVFGLPLGTLLTLILGPVLVRRVPPRKGIMAGAAVCAVATAGFGLVKGSLIAYYGLWILYMGGWIIAGPVAHQILLTRVLLRNRGSGLAISFFGISAFGAVSVAGLARPLTNALGFENALLALGAIMLLAIPVAWKGLPDVGPARAVPSVKPQASVLRTRIFWLLMTGSTMTAAGIAGISQHLKLILRERGYTDQARLDEVFGWTVLLLLGFSALGRFAFAWSADRVPKRHVITIAFLFMLSAMPMLYMVDGTHTPYLFGALFGFGMSTDTLLVALLAAEHFGSATMAKALSVLTPVNAVGQTWFPFAVSLMWELFGNYSVALVVIFGCILTGRLLLAQVPEVVKGEPHAESV